MQLSSEHSADRYTGIIRPHSTYVNSSLRRRLLQMIGFKMCRCFLLSWAAPLLLRCSTIHQPFNKSGLTLRKDLIKSLAHKIVDAVKACQWKPRQWFKSCHEKRPAGQRKFSEPLVTHQSWPILAHLSSLLSLINILTRICCTNDPLSIGRSQRHKSRAVV